MEKRLARLKLSTIRIASALLAGLVSGLIGGWACLAGGATTIILYIVSGLYAAGRYTVLSRREVWSVAAPSTLAAYIVGVYLGSALALG